MKRLLALMAFMLTIYSVTVDILASTNNINNIQQESTTKETSNITNNVNKASVEKYEAAYIAMTIIAYIAVQALLTKIAFTIKRKVDARNANKKDSLKV